MVFVVWKGHGHVVLWIALLALVVAFSASALIGGGNPFDMLIDLFAQFLAVFVLKVKGPVLHVYPMAWPLFGLLATLGTFLFARRLVGNVFNHSLFLLPVWCWPFLFAAFTGYSVLAGLGILRGP
jgi:hypothetical protein